MALAVPPNPVSSRVRDRFLKNSRAGRVLFLKIFVEREREGEKDEFVAEDKYMQRSMKI